MGRIKSTQAPTGDEKKRLLLYQHLSSFAFFSFFFSFCLFISFRLCYLLSVFASPLKHLLSIQRRSFQREKQSFLFNQKGELDLVILKRT